MCIDFVSMIFCICVCMCIDFVSMIFYICVCMRIDFVSMIFRTDLELFCNFNFFSFISTDDLAEKLILSFCIDILLINRYKDRIYRLQYKLKRH